MTPEEKRIAIAEASGWKHTPTEANPSFWFNAHFQANSPWLSYSARDERYLPDYLNDLNAMHEAEKVLTDEQWDKYLLHLSGEDANPSDWPRCYVNLAVVRQCKSATASHLADAFLKTIGKL